MEISHDQLRRELTAARRAQREAMPRWRDALARVFDPASRHTSATKREVLGLPDRRAFLRVGGLTIAMSAVMAACGSSDDEDLPVTGSPPTIGEASGIVDSSQELDVTLLRTAQSIEVLAVETYQRAIDDGLFTETELVDAARLFQEQHREHAGLLSTTTVDAGGTPYDQPNSYLQAQVVAPTLETVEAGEDPALLAVELENTAAQTYVFAAEALSTPALRQGIMSIGAVEARHLAVLHLLQDQLPAPFPLMPRRDRVDPKGYIPPDGPLTPTTPPPGAGTTSTLGG